MKKLSEDMAYWRAERPDEWIMDRFIRTVQQMEIALQIALAVIEDGVSLQSDCDFLNKIRELIKEPERDSFDFHSAMYLLVEQHRAEMIRSGKYAIKG